MFLFVISKQFKKPLPKIAGCLLPVAINIYLNLNANYFFFFCCILMNSSFIVDIKQLQSINKFISIFMRFFCCCYLMIDNAVKFYIDRRWFLTFVQLCMCYTNRIDPMNVSLIWLKEEEENEVTLKLRAKKPHRNGNEKKKYTHRIRRSNKQKIIAKWTESHLICISLL